MTTTTSDHRIAIERGSLFARSWLPSGAGPERARPPHPGRGLRPAPGGRASILLLHDSLGCVELWRDFPERLAAATKRRVVAYDRLGFGRSDAYPGPLPLSFIRDEARDAVPFVRGALGLDALIAFGHSVGGAMAVATAVASPDSCAAVVTMSAQAFVEERTIAGLRAARVAFEQPGQLERLARYHGAKAHWVLDSWVETWLSPSFAGWKLDDDLRETRCPVLALHGDRDEYGSTEHPERIAGLSRGPSRAVILQDCGHVPHREQPQRVIDAASDFLVGMP